MSKIKRLPDAEFDVMLIIWQSKKAIHTGEIMQKLSLQKQCSLQMVQSTLNRLQNKGFISSNKISKFNYYLPLIDEEVYRELETETFIEKMYHNSPAKLVTTLLSKQAMTKDEIEEIRHMLEQGGD